MKTQCKTCPQPGVCRAIAFVFSRSITRDVLPTKKVWERIQK